MFSSGSDTGSVGGLHECNSGADTASDINSGRNSDRDRDSDRDSDSDQKQGDSEEDSGSDSGNARDTPSAAVADAAGDDKEGTAHHPANAGRGPPMALLWALQGDGGGGDGSGS